jgi:hypothetical protein
MHSGVERNRASSQRWSRQTLRSKNEPLQTSRIVGPPPYSAPAVGRCTAPLSRDGGVAGVMWPFALGFGEPVVGASGGRVVPRPLVAASAGS